MFQFKCCGVEGKGDFANATKWNRDNPWVSGTKFTYPLTCCPLSSFQQDWNNLPVDQLKQAASCALNGIGIYETVSLSILDRIRIYI